MRLWNHLWNFFSVQNVVLRGVYSIKDLGADCIMAIPLNRSWNPVSGMFPDRVFLGLICLKDHNL